MFKVNCPGCEAPYQVDERRVPATGLNMRCPKCSTSFQVDSPTQSASASAKEPTSPVPRRAPKPTMMGMAPGIGGPPPRKPPPPAPSARLPTSEAADAVYEVASLMPDEEDDLPAPVPSLQVPPPPRPFGASAGAQPRTAALQPPRAPTPAAPVVSVALEPEPSEIDLPSPAPPEPGAPRGSTRPLVARTDVSDFGDVSLPELVDRGAGPPARAFPSALSASAAFELDLPQVPGGNDRFSPAAAPSGFGDLDLDDVPLPELHQGQVTARVGEVDLPTRAGASPTDPPGGVVFGDLPSPAFGQGRSDASAGLPSLSREDALPSLLREDALPSLSREDALPSLSREDALPSPFQSLPSPKRSPEGGLPQLSSEPPEHSEALPDFGKLPSLSNRPPPMGMAPARGGKTQLGPFGSHPPGAGGRLFGELDDDLGFGSDPPRANLSGPPPAAFGGAQGGSSQPPARKSLAAGPDSFGEISLPGADSLPAADLNSGPTPAPLPTYGQAGGPLELDTAGASQRPPGNVSVFSSVPPAVTAVAGARRAIKPERESKAPARRSLKIAALILTPIFLGGGALTFLPEVGPFGYYFVSDQLNREAHAALLQASVMAARTAQAEDTFAAGKRAFEGAKAARLQAPREKSFVAYAVFVGFLHKLRFEKSPEIQASAEVLMSELTDAGTVPYLELARAAAASSRDNLARPLNQLRDLQKREPRNIDVLVMYAEMALRVGKEPMLAVSAWERAQAVERSPRTWFGLARAKHQAEDAVGALAAAEAALKANADHCGAKVLLAEIVWEDNEQEAKATRWLAAVIESGAKASPEELVRAYTLSGDIHASRSRISQAEKDYELALKVNPQDALALIGLGKTLQQAGRHSEALARFEASNQVNSDNLKAQLGIAQSKLSLERHEDAEAALIKLNQAHPKEFEVLYWLGRAQDTRGQRVAAEKSYREAIALGGRKLRTVTAYAALVTLLHQLGRDDEGTALLAEAKKSLPNASSIRRAFGDLAANQGNYELALSEYREALLLDPKDVGVKFDLSVTLRRLRRFAAALEAFDQVAQADPDHPGLALERGLLFEESGSREEALKAYEQALAKAPADLDVMLRVGCGKAAAGRGREATQLLRKVLEQRPNSAETSHCLGRALLVEGNNLTDAQRMLQRAVELDPNRAQHHLYVGWVAADVGQAERARASFDKALELDKGFADVYWRRGILFARQGAVKDAVLDFTEALRLRPNLSDVHAALADAYYDLGMEAEALRHWALAVEGKPDESLWQFRYGRLLVANRQEEVAQTHLERAVALGQKEDPRPRWLWEGHHMLARALGAAPAAAEHWEQFLRLSPTDSPYRREAISALERLGRHWEDSP